MTEEEMLLRDIETLLESISLDLKDVARGIATRTEIKPHLQWCKKELELLSQRLAAIKNPK